MVEKVQRVSVRRTEEVRLKLGPEMLERFSVQAEAYGFPLATMAAMAVADWVVSKEQAAANQRMLLMDIGRKMSGDVAKLFEAIADDPAALVEAGNIAKKAQDQLNLTLDGSGPVGG
jgi:hypothetical protein